jgi:hypothetical protein
MQDCQAGLAYIAVCTTGRRSETFGHGISRHDNRFHQGLSPHRITAVDPFSAVLQSWRSLCWNEVGAVQFTVEHWFRCLTVKTPQGVCGSKKQAI